MAIENFVERWNSFQYVGYINTHNYWTLWTKNPLINQPLHSTKVALWYGFIASFIIRPFFFFLEDRFIWICNLYCHFAQLLHSSSSIVQMELLCKMVLLHTLQIQWSSMLELTDIISFQPSCPYCLILIMCSVWSYLKDVFSAPIANLAE